MAPATSLPTTTTTAAQAFKLTLTGEHPAFGDFRDDLAHDGFAVVKGAVPRERADAYGKKFYEYLEGL
jgi:hypothetical protein